jgi:hypothetical protein
MLGALEVKAITRFAAQHPAEWKPLHTAVLQGLLAHRNRRTGRCFPERRLLAAHCNVSERTIDRTLDQLTAWGAIERQQPRAVTSQQFREVQYVFLFELPQAAENACDSQEKSCADQPGRATKSRRAVRQNHAEPCDKNGRAVRQNRGANKEEGKDLEGKDQIQRERGSDRPPRSEPSLNQTLRGTDDGRTQSRCQTCGAQLWRRLDGKGLICYQCPNVTKPQYEQRDFDERDWRKLNHEIAMLQEASVGNWSKDSGEERFKVACQRAGISPRRGYELWGKMMA